MAQKKEFLNYVIKDLISDLKTEAAIGNEFIDKEERGSFFDSYLDQSYVDRHSYLLNEEE